MDAVYLPANLKLEQLIKEHGPNFTYDIDKFRYIIGTLIMLQVRRKSYEEEEYIPLHSTILQQRIRNYHQYLKYLVNHAVLETNWYYEPGKKSRAYRLAPEYRKGDFVYTKLMNRFLIRKTNEERSRERYLRRHYGHLTKWFNRNLQIDKEGAIELLKGLRDRETAENKTRKDKIDPMARYYIRKISVDKIHNGIFEYNVDNTSKRFHSNLTNLKSELRNYVTYEGKTLCSVDIKNSQPFFSMIFFNPAFYGKEKGKINLHSISPSIYQTILPLLPFIKSLLPTTSIYTMLVKSDETQCGSDLELYCTLVDKGRLYQFLSDQYFERTGIYFDLAVPDQKRELKRWFFWILYSQEEYRSYSKGATFRSMFRRLFPTVSRIFSFIKQVSHAHLPIILQLVESEIILNRVTRNIAKQAPDLPLFTIHDSIATLADQYQIVYDQLKMECESALGLKPSLHVEKWEAAESGD